MAPSKNTFLFVCFLVATVVVVPAAAQLGGPFGDFLNRLFGIRGTLFCSPNLNGTAGSNGSIPLSNALVQIRCGQGNGTVVGTSMTNSTGQFQILLGILTSLTQVFRCRLVPAPTPQCNATTLPAFGSLISNLISNGTITVSPFRLIPLSPIGFPGIG